MTTAQIRTAALSGIARRDGCSAQWFDALAGGFLMLRRCVACDHISRPDSRSCPSCHAEHLEWTNASGGGTVVCVIRDHSTGEPCVLGIVELDEGPWLLTRLIDLPTPAVGSSVALFVLAAPGDGEPVPAFAMVRVPVASRNFPNSVARNASVTLDTSVN